MDCRLSTSTSERLTAFAESAFHVITELWNFQFRADSAYSYKAALPNFATAGSLDSSVGRDAQE
jgi:hypothetical protein